MSLKSEKKNTAPKPSKGFYFEYLCTMDLFDNSCFGSLFGMMHFDLVESQNDYNLFDEQLIGEQIAEKLGTIVQIRNVVTERVCVIDYGQNHGVRVFHNVVKAS